MPTYYLKNLFQLFITSVVKPASRNGLYNSSIALSLLL
nr:MAG TPA: hypothetical protein [Caudoviricetes sp.]DAW31966.1 MAG TPA: hypothetical protein [Caudoviricetes sp.]